ncbi:MAG: flippase-like domain-containing protein [Proteobacteria bacterium]|nr:flippase-like domain-containing protein [Pseudomonadota bacterium]
MLKTYLIANFLNLFMPGVIGGDAYRAMRTRRQTGGMAQALPSILLDRITGTLALFAVGLMGLTAFLAPQYLVLVAAAGVLALALGYALVRGPVRRLFERARLDAWFGLPRLARGIVAALDPTAALLWVLVIALVFQFNTVLINWLYGVLIGIDVPFSKLLLIVPIVYLAEAVPISIGGLGVREGRSP